MFPLVAGERDCPTVDILAMHNDQVDVVIFEHSLFHLADDPAHAALAFYSLPLRDRLHLVRGDKMQLEFIELKALTEINSAELRARARQFPGGEITLDKVDGFLGLRCGGNK